MKILLAFYKGKGDWFDALMRWKTKSPYSHVEIFIDGSWYTSSNRDRGVRLDKKDHNRDSWDFYEVPVDCHHVYTLFNRTLGDGYDWVSFLWHLLGLPEKHCKDSWTSSEWVATALRLPHAYKQTPKDLHRWASKFTRLSV